MISWIPFSVTGCIGQSRTPCTTLNPCLFQALFHLSPKFRGGFSSGKLRYSTNPFMDWVIYLTFMFGRLEWESILVRDNLRQWTPICNRVKILVKQGKLIFGDFGIRLTLGHGKFLSC